MKKYTDKQRLDFLEANNGEIIHDNGWTGKRLVHVLWGQQHRYTPWFSTRREAIDAAIRAQEKRK